ncbi:MAG: dockerin type I domain-containing protein [Coprobacillaceae bacterium]
MKKNIIKISVCIFTLLSVFSLGLLNSSPVEAASSNGHSKFDCPLKDKHFFDFNDDNRVDILDLMDFNAVKSNPEHFAEYLPYADFNRNGVVDEEDSTMFHHFLNNPSTPLLPICESIYLFDYNENGVIDAEDEAAFMRAISDPTSVTEIDLFYFDANEDGYIDILDLMDFQYVKNTGNNIEICKYAK